MTVRGDMERDVEESPAEATSASAGSSAVGGFRLLQVLLLGLTVAGVVVGIRISVPGGVAPITSVAFGLTIVWALVGFVDTRTRERAGSKASPFHVLAGVDAFVAMVALTAGRQAETIHASGGARDLATMSALAVTAISFHFLLALPDGRLRDTVRRTTVVLVYLAALGVGLGLVAGHDSFTVVDGAISWVIAGALAVPPMQARYVSSIGYLRERMEWFGIGGALAATVSLIATVLHMLVGWPGPLGAV